MICQIKTRFRLLLKRKERRLYGTVRSDFHIFNEIERHLCTFVPLLGQIIFKSVKCLHNSSVNVYSNGSLSVIFFFRLKIGSKFTLIVIYRSAFIHIFLYRIIVGAISEQTYAGTRLTSSVSMQR